MRAAYKKKPHTHTTLKVLILLFVLKQLLGGHAHFQQSLQPSHFRLFLLQILVHDFESILADSMLPGLTLNGQSLAFQFVSQSVVRRGEHLHFCFSVTEFGTQKGIVAGCLQPSILLLHGIQLLFQGNHMRNAILQV